MILVEVAGLRILHWGDNRPNPPDHVWDLLGAVDVALLPVDGSQHVLSYPQVEAVAERLRAKVIVPHHYYVWDVTTRASTLLPPDEWVNGRAGSRWLGEGSVRLERDAVRALTGTAMCFGGHVGFVKPIKAAGDPGA